MSDYCIGFSASESASRAVEEACKELYSKDVRLIVFISDDMRFSEISKLLHAKLPRADIIGSTTYAAFSGLGYAKTSLALMAFCDNIECACGVILNIRKYPMQYKPAVDDCLNRLSSRKNLFCYEMTTGFSYSDELVLDTIRSSLGADTPIFGSCAGSADGAKFTMVSINGRVYREGCVFALISSDYAMKLYRENIYVPTGDYFTATDVDCEERMVYRFDDKPASAALANALGVETDKLVSLFSSHPLGRIINDKYYLIEGLETEGEGVRFFARVYNNTRMALMTLGDYDKINDKLFNQIKREIGRPDFSIVVNCLGRTKLFEEKGFTDVFQSRMKAYLGDFICISGYGEHFYGKHLNASMIVAAFKRSE